MGSAALLLVCGFFWAGCSRTQPDSPETAFHRYAFVSNGKSDTVTVVDLDGFRVARTVAVGDDPTGVTASPVRNEVYVVNTGSGSVSVLNAETLKSEATIPVGQSPFSLELSPDGKIGYVANAGSASVSIVDLEARRVRRTIATGRRPGEARVSPDGKDRKSTRLNSSHIQKSRMPSSA